MFSKLSLLVLVAPLVSALSISAPTNVSSGGTFTIKWTSATGDPDTFSLELTNPAFNNAIAIANNVDPSTGSLTLQCPIVAAGGAYTIQAVNIGNINQVYAETSLFSIGATVTSSSSTLSATASGSTFSTRTGTVTTANSPVTTSNSLTTIPTGASTLTGTGTGAASAASTTPSAASAASTRLALTNAGSYAVLVLSVVAGAAAIAL